MSFMLTLFERGDFIQEVQALLGERLLTEESATSDLEKEVRFCAPPWNFLLLRH